MKAFLTCVLLLGVLQVNGAPLNSEQKEQLLRYHKDCIRQTNVDKVLIDQARNGIYTDDPIFKDFLLCFSRRIGFQDVKGVVQKDVLEKKVSKVIEDPGILSKLVEQCSVQKDTPENTSFNIANCLREVAPDLEYFKVAPEIVYPSNEQTEKFLVQHKECVNQAKQSQEVIENAIKQGNIYDGPDFKDYIYCLAKKQGVLRDDGMIIKEKFYECFRDLIKDNIEIDRLAEKCLLQQDTPENTAFFISKCVCENSPVYTDFFPRDIRVSEEAAKEIVQHFRACLKETGIDRELFYKTRHGIFSDDPKLKEFLLCGYKKAGILDDSGNFQIDALRKRTLEIFKDPIVVQKLIDLCTVTHSTPQETAFYVKQCIYKNAPGHLNVSQLRQEKKRQVVSECCDETGVSNSTVLSARNGDFQDDPLLKQYFFCINKKFGTMKETGEFNQYFIKKYLTKMLNRDKAEKITEQCFKTLDTPENSSFESFKCFYKHSPEEAAKAF